MFVLWHLDEELGGLTGMVKFIETKEFKELNIGLALDEGISLIWS